MRYVQEYDFKGKTALIRVDFNVPLDNRFGVVDDTRILGAIPTIKHVLDGGGAAVLLSHLGRPRQGYEQSCSLQHLVPYLSQILETKVAFVPHCVGPDVQERVQQLAPGNVLMLENVRFQDGETTGDPALARALSSWGDVYINDAFGTAHRAHTSTTLLANYFKDKLMGFLMQKELTSANKILKSPKRPLIAVIGGAKIADKVQPLVRLLDQLDYLLLGGGVANTFQKALGGQVGASLLEPDQVTLAWQLAQQAQQKKVRLVLPSDIVVSSRLCETADKKVVAGESIPVGWMGLDIGPQARQEFSAIVQDAQTILWCGPLGFFEMPTFRKGTQAVAKAVVQATKQGAFSLIGGGDSAAAISGLHYADHVSHLSTGGGALLSYLSGLPLPGVVALA